MTDEPSDYRHIESAYDAGADDYSAYHSEPHESVEPERQLFVAALPRGSSILDCGCGPGIEAERFTQVGYRVTAIDLSERFVALTKRRVPGARVEKMDMRQLDFPDAVFDGVWASFSLLHIQERDAATTLAGLRRVLREGGLLFVALHRAERTAWVKTRITAMARETYVQEWRQDDVEAAVIVAGFRMISSRRFSRTGGQYPLLAILAEAMHDATHDSSSA